MPENSARPIAESRNRPNEQTAFDCGTSAETTQQLATGRGAPAAAGRLRRWLVAHAHEKARRGLRRVRGRHVKDPTAPTLGPFRRLVETDNFAADVADTRGSDRRIIRANPRHGNALLATFAPWRFSLSARKKSPPRARGSPRRAWKKSGDTYSRTLGTTIGSESLTTVFGMGTGVAFQIWSPESSRGRR
jgi:hypothetical protein